jgi:hypothetical protein
MKKGKNTNEIDFTTSLKRPISKIAHMIAKITLRFNFLVFEFIELYKFHVVKLARKQNPTYSMVELAARTGLDRRYVSDTLKNEKLKTTATKPQLVLDEIRRICFKNQTKYIDKYGENDSFDSICQKISSSSLTSSSIAKELIRQNEIMSIDDKIKVFNLVDTPAEKTLIYYHEHRSIIAAIKKYCNLNNTKFILKSGVDQSFEQILEQNKSGMFSKDKLTKDLINNDFIVDCGDKYKLIEWVYFANHKNVDEFSRVLSVELERLTNTIIYNFNTDSDTTPVYQRNIYTNKITPKNISVLKGDIADIINRTTIDIGKLFDKNEESTGKTYTNVGASFFVFKDAEEYY